MSSFRIRPRFEHAVALSPEDIRGRLLQALAQQSPSIEVKSFPGFLCLRVPEKERTLWSPRLMLGIEPTADQTTRIEGVYGPNANLWSLFLFGYLIVGSIGIFSGILGWAQHVIGAYPWGLWICGTMAVLALTFYLVAQLGQKLGAWQTFQLHTAYESAMGVSAPLR